MKNWAIFIQTIILAVAGIAIVNLSISQAKMIKREAMYEAKIKEMDRSINFGVLTDFGKDQKALELWNRMDKDCSLDKLFSWQTYVDK